MKQLISIAMISFLMVLIACFSCSKDDDSLDSGIIKPGDDPNFTIVANTDKTFEGVNRKVEVFGISIYAVSKVDDAKLLHAANVMAQYLDNDEDGVVDNSLVLESMIKNNAFLFMWASESDMNNINVPDNSAGQDLGNDETNPSFVSNGRIGEFDAALEEVWHLINFSGHCLVYPEAFGLEVGSDLANAMDNARGGQFQSIPSSYPADAWYTYDDETCTYADCQTVEYFYWAMTSILGAQDHRSGDIGNEWRLNTRELVRTGDAEIYNLLTDPKYKLPTNLPDGTYMR